MARLPLARRESVPENQRAAFDELLRGYGSVPRFGPGSVMIHVPNAHQRVNALNNYLRSESSLPKIPDDESAVVHFGQEYFRTHRVSIGAFQAVLEQIGTRGAVELGLLMGNYSLLALLVNSFDVELPPDRKEPLLPV